jgi:hypothetical protein
VNRATFATTGAVVATALAILALPPGASAKAPLGKEAPTVTATMSVPASNGYSITVMGTSRYVVLLAEKGSVFAVYQVPGRVTRKGLRANFGRFGRVSVRFKRIGRPKAIERNPSARGCKGRGPVQESGRFEGTIRFRGEGGFTEVTAKSAKGSVMSRFRHSCGARGERRATGALAAAEDADTGTALLVEDKSPNRTVGLMILNIDAGPSPGEPGLFLSLPIATVTEVLGRMTVAEAAIVEGDRGSLLASPVGIEPRTATVNLPPPFAGTASYLEQAGSPPSWTGSLKVRLPGGEVPLTGAGFTALLCHEKSPRKFETCLDQANDTTAPPTVIVSSLQRRLLLRALGGG